MAGVTRLVVVLIALLCAVSCGDKGSDPGPGPSSSGFVCAYGRDEDVMGFDECNQEDVHLCYVSLEWWTNDPLVVQSVSFRLPTRLATWYYESLDSLVCITNEDIYFGNGGPEDTHGPMVGIRSGDRWKAYINIGFHYCRLETCWAHSLISDSALAVQAVVLKSDGSTQTFETYPDRLW